MKDAVGSKNENQNTFENEGKNSVRITSSFAASSSMRPQSVSEQAMSARRPRELIQRLQRDIRSVETASTVDACDRTDSCLSTITTGLEALDQWLPERGYRRGSMVEWLVPGGNSTNFQTVGFGAELLSLQVASRAAARGGSIVVVDPTGEFYPLAARSLGIELHRLVILRGERLEDLYWAIDQSLRCEAVAAVWAAASPQRPRFLVDMDERWQRRFQLAAEAGGSIGLFLRPDRVARQPTWCDVQWRIIPQSLSREVSVAGVPDLLPGQSLPENYWRRLLSIQLLRCRGGRSGQTLHCTLDTRTGEMTRTTALRRVAQRASPQRPVPSAPQALPRQTG
jgi:hypothetical protein